MHCQKVLGLVHSRTGIWFSRVRLVLLHGFRGLRRVRLDLIFLVSSFSWLASTCCFFSCSPLSSSSSPSVFLSSDELSEELSDSSSSSSNFLLSVFPCGLQGLTWLFCRPLLIRQVPCRVKIHFVFLIHKCSKHEKCKLPFMSRQPNGPPLYSTQRWYISLLKTHAAQRAATRIMKWTQ